MCMSPRLQLTLCRIVTMCLEHLMEPHSRPWLWLLKIRKTNNKINTMTKQHDHEKETLKWKDAWSGKVHISSPA